MNLDSAGRPVLGSTSPPQYSIFSNRFQSHVTKNVRICNFGMTPTFLIVDGVNSALATSYIFHATHKNKVVGEICQSISVSGGNKRLQNGKECQTLNGGTKQDIQDYTSTKERKNVIYIGSKVLLNKKFIVNKKAF